MDGRLAEYLVEIVFYFILLLKASINAMIFLLGGVWHSLREFRSRLRWAQIKTDIGIFASVIGALISLYTIKSAVNPPVSAVNTTWAPSGSPVQSSRLRVINDIGPGCVWLLKEPRLDSRPVRVACNGENFEVRSQVTLHRKLWWQVVVDTELAWIADSTMDPLPRKLVQLQIDRE